MTKEKTEPYIEAIDRETLRLFWRATLATDKPLLLRSLLSPAGTILLGSIVPLFIGKILATLGNSGTNAKPYLIGFAVTAVIGFLCNRYGFTAFLKVQALAMRHLHAQALEILLKRSVGFHNNNVSGKLVSDALDFPNGYGQLVNAVFAMLLPLALTLVSGTVIIFFESWILGLVVFTMTAVIVGTGMAESHRRAGLRKKRMVATKKLTAHLADTIVNAQTVKTFAREKDEMAEHHAFGKTLLGLRFKDWTKAALKGNERIGMLLLMQAAFVFVVVKLVQDNPQLLGVGIFAFSFTIVLSNRLFDINTMIRNFEDGLLLAAPMTAILQEEVEIQDRAGAKPLTIDKGAITFDSVTFRYQDSNSDQAVFESLNLLIKPGEKVGLVGPSGGGKSTLTRLLLRFEDISGGRISIDGQDVANVTQQSLRANMAYVPQEPLMFHRSVRENIAYGNPKATETMIVKAAKAAHAHDFITELQNGYDTIVGERGVKLSGGQRQRIAIARAILKDSPILVLDEATSALDSESEVFIQDALWKLMEGRTAIVIAHRLSTIQKMDRIIVLDRGQIVEEGTHKQLLARKGTYARLWSHQSGGFLEDEA